MKGINFDAANGRITIVNGDRIVATTDGTLVNLLPDEVVIDDELAVFPDFDKSTAYLWLFRQQGSTGNWFGTSSCSTFIAALPQEYSHTTVLMDAPAGADFFMGMVRFSRTQAPSHSWMDAAISAPDVAGKWVPWAGSMLMEADSNFARALHVYIDDDPLSPTYRKFVMRVQQSVGPPDGGYDSSFPTANSGGAQSGGGLVNGANTTSGPTNGFSVLQIDSKTDAYSSSIAPNNAMHRWDAAPANRCSRTDITDYTSSYSVDIRGRFGRRS